MKIAFTTAINDKTDIIAFALKKTEVAGFSFGFDDDASIHKALEAGRFTGAAGQSFLLFANRGGNVVRLVVLGVGEGRNADYQSAGGNLIAKVQTCGASHMAVSGDNISAEDAAYLAYGVKLRNWRWDNYRTKMADNLKPSVTQCDVVTAGGADNLLWDRLSAVADGVFLTRELVTEPANIIYPESFVQRCQHLAEMGVEITVLDEKEMAALGMGALLGVAQGSAKKPRLLAMRWDGTGGKTEKPVVFVGKGVTFDTGGISLKPPAGMEDMKWDMGGAGAVAGAMKALAGRKANAHVVGVCGLVENMPDANAQRPGDVVTSMSGQTIEVINTDAEGRLVLCDALHWAQEQYNPEYVIDLATLTGAIIISLAHEHAGLFTNDDDLSDKLTAAGKATGDSLWRFPLGKAYDKMIDSPIADMKNVGARGGGSITAAQFLQRYIKDGVKWAHLDIAGTAWSDKSTSTWAKGATGFGVRLLDKFIADNFEK
ncbi:leucyl aminopeptidase [Sphingorhabdus lutea]|uniref:Probable cytosol aminopeptidase n=1 Tax=Sphingorhabdus lutea TaxID=1913578 RepID=A0A1L3JCK1_9SPHN|nr:leucyl aminopeptidase [Sphingorhabdus lutea]APG62856.1 leucyl aminopeptidase [Sphingorhabdus lutea]